MGRRQPGPGAGAYRAGGRELKLTGGGGEGADVDAVSAQVAEEGGCATRGEARAVQVRGCLAVGVAAAAARDAQGAAAVAHN